MFSNENNYQIDRQLKLKSGKFYTKLTALFEMINHQLVGLGDPYPLHHSLLHIGLHQR